MDPKNDAAVPGDQLEGEGNKTADKRYREGATAWSKSGQAMGKAQEAERDLEKNPGEYRNAEERGRAPGKGEDLPGDLSGESDKKM